MTLRWAWAALTVGFLITGLPSLQKAVVPNNALTVWFLESDSLLVNYKTFQRHFGNDETISLIVTDPEGIINKTRLEQIGHLTKELEKIEGVAHVFSLTNSYDLKLHGSRVSFEKPIPETLSSDNKVLEEIRSELIRSSLFVNRFIDSTAAASMIYIQMEAMENFDAHRDAIVSEVRSVAEQILGPENTHLGGLGVVYSGLNQITSHDFGLFLALSYLVMFIIIYVIFRRAVLVIIALSGVFISSILTLECYGYLGYQVNMLTMTIPTITIILAILDSLHMIHEYYVESSRAGAGELRIGIVSSSLKKVFLPCLFTTLTTMAGLISFVFSPMAVLREFGWFSSLGILLAFVCSFIFAAVFLPFIRFDQGTLFEKTFFRDRVLRLFDGLYHRPARYVALIVIICLISIYGMTRIKVDTYTIKYLPDDHRVVQDHEFIRAHWGDYLTLEYLITPYDEGAIGDPKFLETMKTFESDCRKLPEIHNALGIHSLRQRVLEQMPAAASIDQMVYDDTPDDQNLTAIFTDRDFKIARLTLIGSMMSARHLDDLLTRVDSIAQKHFKGMAKVEASGYPPLYARIIDYIITSQIQSFYLALFMIYGLMILLLRSIKLATISLVPNVLPILFLFGAMGLLDLTLDIATATTAAIVLGFSIDDTIHFMVHYQRSLKEGTPYLERLRGTYSHCVDALMLNSLVLFLGYAVLLFASVKTVYYFGLLTLIAIAGGLVAELLVLPILLKTFDKTKIPIDKT
jgi:predicted RND superfamily exporter protein